MSQYKKTVKIPLIYSKDYYDFKHAHYTISKLVREAMHI